jgi:hypothetical protein
MPAYYNYEWHNKQIEILRNSEDTEELVRAVSSLVDAIERDDPIFDNGISHLEMAMLIEKGVRAFMHGTLPTVWQCKTVLKRSVNQIERQRYDRCLSMLALAEAHRLTHSYLMRIGDVRMMRYGMRQETEGDALYLQDNGTVDQSAVSSDQNLMDIKGNAEDVEDAGQPDIAHTGARTLLPMGDFLARPVLIYSATIPLDPTTVSVNIQPWDLFFAETSVRAKLKNYAYFRGDLRIRVTLSGTPFHYGRLLFSYQPFSDMNGVLNSFSAATFSQELRNCYLSQAPGATVMDVKANQPMEMVLPFILPKPMARLYNAITTALGASTNYSDIHDMGKLYITTLNTVKSVSSSPTSVEMAIYAWVDNAELGTTTGTVIALDTEGDEDETGPIERVSSKLANMSRTMEVVPGIAPYAEASSMVFQGLQNLASLFGFSRPPVSKPICHMKTMPYASGSHTIGTESLVKISMDPKQGLTVDPRVMGSSEDEMSLRHIYTRESYLDTFTWAATSTPMSTILWQSCVSPSLNRFEQVNTYNIFQPTAMAYVAQLFNFWRGDIVFRLEIVASSLHRGKLAVYYDPNIIQHSLIVSDLFTNKQYLKLVDIQETQNVEFCINWAQAREWLSKIEDSQYYAMFGDNFTANSKVNHVNGMIWVTPFTALQSPDTSDIQVNVYVRGKSLDFNYPSEDNLPTTRIYEDPEVLETEGDAMTGFSHYVASEEITCEELNDPNATTDHICESYFGERPFSFRSLLKRYGHEGVLSDLVARSAGSLLRADYPIIPPINPSYDGLTTDRPSLFNYMRYAYVGMRGGLRKRYAFNTDGVFRNMAQIRVSMYGLQTTQLTPVVDTDAYGHPTMSLTGTEIFIPGVNGGVEVEFPFYTNNLFYMSFNQSLTSSGSVVFEDRFLRNCYLLWWSVTATTYTYIVSDLAIGEDFSFLRFQGAPHFTEA